MKEILEKVLMILKVGAEVEVAFGFEAGAGVLVKIRVGVIA